MREDPFSFLIETLGLLFLGGSIFIVGAIILWLIFDVFFARADDYILECVCGKEYGRKKQRKLKYYKNGLKVWGREKKRFKGVTWLRLRWHKMFNCKKFVKVPTK